MPKANYTYFQNDKLKQYAILVFLWSMIFLSIFLVRAVILPFVLALLLAYVFEPIIKLLEKINVKNFTLPRTFSVLLIYSLIAFLFFLLGAFFIPQMYREIIKLTKEITAFINSIDENTIANFGNNLENFFRLYNLPFEIIDPKLQKDPNFYPNPNWISIDLISIYQNLIQDILFYIKSETKSIILSMQYMLSYTANFLFLFFLVLMITAFILADVDRIRSYLFKLIPPDSHDKFSIFLERLDQRLSGVVRGQFIICLINALLTLIGLLIFDIKFAFILATIAGILSLVPIFGSIISTIPIVLAALTQSSQKALLALIWIIAIHALEANLLNPKIMGHSAKIHPVLIILSLLIGERFYGITGALLAVPIISILITAFNSLLGIALTTQQNGCKTSST